MTRTVKTVMFLLVVVLVVVVKAETKALKSTQLARVPFFALESVGVSCTLCTSGSVLINGCPRASA